jgi:YHS domain-containing protein
VTVKGQTIYVCCAKCAAKVQADPDPYLAKVASERTGSGRVSTAGPYGGQKHCPVTGEELDPDGGAIPVMVRGETIYVCCGGCARKVKSNPDAYLAKVRAERSSRAAAGY